MAGILVVAENYEGRLRSATFHAVQAALSYAKVKGEPDVFALVLGTDASKLASELALYPLAEVFCLEQPEVAHYTAEAYSEAISQFWRPGRLILSSGPPRRSLKTCSRGLPNAFGGEWSTKS